MRMDKKKIGNKLVISIIATTLLLGLFIPVVSSMGCNGGSTDPNHWAYAGHWEYHHYREKVYVGSPWWHGFFRGDIDGIDEDGRYYYYDYSDEKSWITVWGTTQDGPDVHIYHYPH